MTRRLTLLLVAAASLLAACGKKRSQRAEIVECSNISLDAKGTTQCLVELYHWKVVEAQRAATARAREMDSLKTWKEDSVWHIDAARHKRDVQTCRRGKDPLDTCLLVAGWPVDRVKTTAESLWQSEAPQHRRELEACQRKREMNLSSCLTLYYKWDSDRALKIADSVTRVRLGGVPQQRRR